MAAAKVGVGQDELVVHTGPRSFQRLLHGGDELSKALFYAIASSIAGCIPAMPLRAKVFHWSAWIVADANVQIATSCDWYGQ